MTARKTQNPGASDNPEAPDGRHPDDITLLRSWHSWRLTKRFSPEGKGGYDNEHLFDHHYERCGSIERIFETLEALKDAPSFALRP